MKYGFFIPEKECIDIGLFKSVSDTKVFEAMQISKGRLVKGFSVIMEANKPYSIRINIFNLCSYMPIVSYEDDSFEDYNTYECIVIYTDCTDIDVFVEKWNSLFGIDCELSFRNGAIVVSTTVRYGERFKLKRFFRIFNRQIKNICKKTGWIVGDKSKRHLFNIEKSLDGRLEGDHYPVIQF